MPYAKDYRPVAPEKRQGSALPPKMRLTGPDLVYRASFEDVIEDQETLNIY